jgi:peptidoglycan-N-acetylglucosamine deacetylase
MDVAQNASKPPKTVARIVFGLALLALLGYGGFRLNAFRIEAGGIRNVLSRAWWKEHLSGDDLFNHTTRVFKRGNRQLREVCLTFDDGPHPESCKSILATLKLYNAKATFFLVGKRIKENPALTKEILAEGFEVGNHTQDHLRLDTLRLDQVRNELINCETNFYRATGSHMALFRPPGMRYNDGVLSVAHSLNYVIVHWDVGAKDFVGGKLTQIHQDPHVIAGRVIKQLDNGVIILLHDNPDTAAALPIILEELKKRGLASVNATTMMSHLPRPVLVRSNAGEVHSDPSLVKTKA